MTPKQWRCVGIAASLVGLSVSVALAINGLEGGSVSWFLIGCALGAANLTAFKLNARG